MKTKTINPVGKHEAGKFAAKVLENVFGCRIEKSKYLGGGSFGFVFIFSIDKPPHRVVMKACRTEGICEREAQELALLGEDSFVKVPEVYFTFTATDEIPIDFICMEPVDGTNCFNDFSKLLCSKKKKLKFAEEVAAAIHHWHEKTNDKFGLISDPCFDEWLDFFKPFAEEILESARELKVSGKLEAKVVSVMERAWDAFDFIFSEKVEKASLIHGDVNVMNIMSDKNLGSLAIIDPLESKWADFEYELFQLRNLTGDRFGLYEAYKRIYPVSEKCDLKTSFYALFHEVYAFIISGTKVNMILMPLVRRLNKELDKNGL